MKKLICWLLAVCLIASLFPIAAFAAESGSCGANLKWSYSDGVLTITGTGDMDDYDHNTAPWQEHRLDVTQICLPEGLTSIGNYAFQFCKLVSEIQIPETVTRIGESAFICCYALADVNIPACVTSIGKSAFENCDSLRAVDFPQGLETIEYGMFFSSGLETFEIPEGVVRLGDRAFMGCSSLKEVTIPDSVTEMGEWAFSSCTALKQVELPQELDSVSWGCFSGTGLTSVEIPEGVKRLESYAFSGCGALTEILIPDTVTVIDQYALRGTESLKTVELPSGLKATGYGMFQRSGLESIKLPEGLTKISEYTFCDCKALTQVDMPDTVVYILDYAFRGCTSLTTVKLSQSLKYLPWGMFQFSGLQELVIPESVTYTEDYVFANCDDLRSITYPEGRFTFGAYAFRDCEGPVTFDLPGNMANVSWGMFSDSTIEYIHIPDSVSVISDYAFSGCDYLKEVTLPDTLTDIGDMAFRDCAIEYVKLPSQLKRIGLALFWNSKIRELEIPWGVTSIEHSAFQNADNLKKLIVPPTVRTIQEPNPFDEADQLTIHCWADTVIERYARENSIPYVLLDEDPQEAVYSVGLVPTANGSVTLSTETARKDRYVSFDFEADAGYEAEKIIVWYDSDIEPDLALTVVDEDTAEFCMPGCDVKIEVEFVNTTTEPTEPEPTDPEPTDPEPTDPELPENPFTDVSETDFYYDAVLWAAGEGITSGTSATTFGPYDPCRRAQVVTFLWRAMGSPKAVNRVNPFSDVKQTDYYYEAVLWAVEQGITSGIAPDAFGPDTVCSRGQIVTFLYRALGEPQVSGENPFADVKPGDYFYTPVLWAVEAGVTSGVAADSFAPGRDCVRAQVVTFLYKALVDQG